MFGEFILFVVRQTLLVSKFSLTMVSQYHFQTSFIQWPKTKINLCLFSWIITLVWVTARCVFMCIHVLKRMCVYMHVWNWCVYLCADSFVCTTLACIFSKECLWWTCVCMQLHVYMLWTYICTCVCAKRYVYVQVYVHVCVFMCVHLRLIWLWVSYLIILYFLHK